MRWSVGAAVICSCVVVDSQALAAVEAPLLDADARRPRARDVVQGSLGTSASFGWWVDDPMATIYPALEFDFSRVVPLWVRLGAPLRLRLHDRAPYQATVLRHADWDEAGDFVAIVERIHYRDTLEVGTASTLVSELRLGRLGRVQLGHGSLVRGFANALDRNRARSGVDAIVRFEGSLLRQPAAIEASMLATDLAGEQLFGARLAVSWANVGLGSSVVGDPTAPRMLARTLDDELAWSARRQLVTTGARGVVAASIDLSYRFADAARYAVTPYVDLATVVERGRGVHVGSDFEFVLGRRRNVRLGVFGEFTFGDGDYDPAYFDVFYLAERWHMQFVARPDAPADVEALMPKATWVQRHDLYGAGGAGGIRFGHRHGAFAETTYRHRPGPLGAVWENRVVLELDTVELGFLYAHRGRTGFEVGELAGTLASVELMIPVHRFAQVTASGGWLFTTRARPSTGDERDALAGIVSGAPYLDVGLVGHIPF